MRSAVRADTGKGEKALRNLVVGKIAFSAESLEIEGSRGHTRCERMEVCAPVPGADGLSIEGLGSGRHRLLRRKRMSAGRRSLPEVLHECTDHAYRRGPRHVGCGDRLHDALE